MLSTFAVGTRTSWCGEQSAGSNLLRKILRLVLPFVLQTVALNCRRLSEHEVSWGEALAIYLSLHEIGNYWSAHAIGTVLCWFRSRVGVECIYSNYVFTAKVRKKKIQDPAHKMSCPPLFCLKNKANILLNAVPHHRCSSCLCVMHILCICNIPVESLCYLCLWFQLISTRSFWKQQEGIFQESI